MLRSIFWLVLAAVGCLSAATFAARLSADETASAEAIAESDVLQRITASDDGKGFVRKPSGERTVFVGANYDHDSRSRLLEEYWHDEWATVEGDFREMKALGLNVVRVHLQLDRFMVDAEKPNEKELAQLARLVKLAEATGLYLDLTGLGGYRKASVPAWYDALSESDRWAVQARFWQAIAKACDGSPAIFCYDLMNEPILPGDKPETEWLGGELGGFHYVQRISLDLAGRTREEVARAWIDQLVGAIREVDAETLITVGEIPWAHVFPGAKPLFHDPQVGERLDFVAVHFYPKRGDVEGSLKALAVYELGKPLVVEEIFPMEAGVDETLAFIDGSRPIADGWISFYWGRTIDENRAAGGIAGALTGDWLEAYSSKIAKPTTAEKAPRP